MHRGLFGSILVASAIVALTGCTAGGSTERLAAPSSSPSVTDAVESIDAPEAEGIETCVVGEWTADLNDLVTQLGEQMASSGASVATADASGDQLLSMGADGKLAFATDMTFVLGVDMGDGTVMTVSQHHTGDVTSSWAWSGDPGVDTGLIAFSNFDSAGYNVDTTISVGGESTDAPFTPPNMAAADVPTRVSCTGDVMTTHPEGTPFATTWARAA